MNVKPLANGAETLITAGKKLAGDGAETLAKQAPVTTEVGTAADVKAALENGAVKQKATEATNHADLVDEVNKGDTANISSQADTVADETTETIAHEFKTGVSWYNPFSWLKGKLSKVLNTLGDITPEAIAKTTKDGDNIIMELTNKATMTFSKVDDQLKMSVAYPEGAGLTNVDDIVIKSETKLPQAVQDKLTEQGLLNKVDDAVEETVENTAEAGAKQLDDGADNAASKTDEVIEEQTEQAVVKADESGAEAANVGDDIADTAEDASHEAKEVNLTPNYNTAAA
jgi:hypothetical protein